MEINEAIALLRAHGFTVTKPQSAAVSETPGEFRTRLSISTAHFHRRVNDPACPGFDAERGPSGRILTLRSNPDFEAWMQKSGAGFPACAATGGSQAGKPVPQ